MNGPEGIRLSEVIQTEKKKYCIISFICGIIKKKKDHQKPICTENKLMVSRHGGGRGGWLGEMGEGS